MRHLWRCVDNDVTHGSTRCYCNIQIGLSARYTYSRRSWYKSNFQTTVLSEYSVGLITSPNANNLFGGNFKIGYVQSGWRKTCCQRELERKGSRNRSRSQRWWLDSGIVLTQWLPFTRVLTNTYFWFTDDDLWRCPLYSSLQARMRWRSSIIATHHRKYY